MFRALRTVTTQLGHRPYKNFGHKRQPVPGVTVLWHGFLTFSFIGLGIEWEKIKRFLFGDEAATEQIEPSSVATS